MKPKKCSTYEEVLYPTPAKTKGEQLVRQGMLSLKKAMELSFSDSRHSGCVGAF